MINQIRSFLLERGIAVRQGPRFLRQQLREILAKRTDVLSPRMIGIIEDLSGDWRRLDERIKHVTEEIEQLAHGSESCRQLMTVPGIGPPASQVRWLRPLPTALPLPKASRSRPVMCWRRCCQRSCEESRAGAVVVCLVPARIDTRWWHDIVRHADETRTYLYGPAVCCKPDVSEREGLVLHICIRPVVRALVCLAIMDIRAHPLSFSKRP